MDYDEFVLRRDARDHAMAIVVGELSRLRNRHDIRRSVGLDDADLTDTLEWYKSRIICTAPNTRNAIAHLNRMYRL